MKKKIISIIVAIVLILLAIRLLFSLWLYCYHQNKNTDNLPYLIKITRMNQNEMDDLLIGYHRVQFLEVWDDPTYQTEYEDYWEIEGYTLILRYDEKEEVISCELIEPNDVE